MDLRILAQQLVGNLNQRMSPSIYDGAWLLRVKTADGSPRWPDYLYWLLEKQRYDGSWGANLNYYHHDRMICTLISVIALTEVPVTPRVRRAIKKAEAYLRNNIYLVFRDPALTELVGFELLFPALIAEARGKGLQIPSFDSGVQSLKNEKLGLVPSGLLYSKDVTIVHSLEFLGDAVDPDKMHDSVFENGSVGNSPATTAFYIRSCLQHGIKYDAGADAYLHRVHNRYRPSIYLFPYRNFENLWVINNFAVADHNLTTKYLLDDRMLDSLQLMAESGGVGLDQEFGIADADCTSVAVYLLRLAGRDVDHKSLSQFEVSDRGYFRTYDFERNLSVSTNIHALEALRLMPAYPGQPALIQKLESLIASSRQYDLFWVDKWHASPYYATAYALIALLKGNSAYSIICHETVRWLFYTQRPDGSWGFFDRGTVEETAYAVMALLFAYQKKMASREMIQRGFNYILKHINIDEPSPAYTELWLGKSLYAPVDIIKSAALAAVIQYQSLFGQLA